jgi:hypothetical protein
VVAPLEPWSSPTTRFWKKAIGGEAPFSTAPSVELLKKWAQRVDSVALPPFLKRRLAFILEDEAAMIRVIAARNLADAFELAMIEEFDTWYAPVLPPGTEKPKPGTRTGLGTVLKYHFPAIVAHVSE